MARPAHYSAQGILDAASELAARNGHTKATIGAIAKALGAPTGSIYHRFASKDALLAELWLQTVESFQVGFQTALSGPEPVAAGLQAALHTPHWVRAHPTRARLLLLHHRNDFLTAGEWPPELLERAQSITKKSENALDGFTKRLFRSNSASSRRRARYAVVELPVAAVISHVRADERPPEIIETLITNAYYGVLKPIGDPTERR